MNVNSSNAVQILLLIGGLTLVPAVLFTVTGFSRILIVLGFIRTAVGTTNAPPNQVLVGIALFLTIFVMTPTITGIKKLAVEPLEAHQISTTTALKRAEVPLRQFMFANTRPRTSSCSSTSGTTRSRRRESACPPSCSCRRSSSRS